MRHQNAEKANVDKNNQAPHILNVNFKIRPFIPGMKRLLKPSESDGVKKLGLPIFAGSLIPTEQHKSRDLTQENAVGSTATDLPLFHWKNKTWSPQRRPKE